MARFGCCKVLTYSSENDLPPGWFLHQKLCGSPDVFIHLQEITILGRELCNSKLIDYHHAILKRISSNGKQHIQVEDNSSIYGTFLNGTKLEDDELVSLKEKDVISLGHPEVTESSFILKYCYSIEDGQIRKEPTIVIVSDKIEDTTCTEAESLETMGSMGQITAPKTNPKRVKSKILKKHSTRRSPTRESSPEDAVFSSEECSEESNDSCYVPSASPKYRHTSDENSNISSEGSTYAPVTSVSKKALNKERLSYKNVYENIDLCSVTSVESSSSSSGSKQKAKASRGADVIGYDNESSSSDSSNPPPDDDSKFIKFSSSSDSGSCSDTSVIVDDSSSNSSCANNTDSNQKNTKSNNTSAHHISQSENSTASKEDIPAKRFKRIRTPEIDSFDSNKNAPESFHSTRHLAMSNSLHSAIMGSQFSTIPFPFENNTLEQDLPKEKSPQNFDCDKETSHETQVKYEIFHKSFFDDSASPPSSPSLLDDLTMTNTRQKREFVHSLPSPSFLSNKRKRSCLSSSNEKFTKLKPAVDTNSKGALTNNLNISQVSSSLHNGPNSPEVVFLLDSRIVSLHPAHKDSTSSVTSANQPLPVASSPANKFPERHEKITDFEFGPQDFVSLDEAEFDNLPNPDIKCKILPDVGTNDSNVSPSRCKEPRPNISDSDRRSPLPTPKIRNEINLTLPASPTTSKLFPVIISPTSLYSQKQGGNAVKRPAASLSKLSRKRLKLDSKVSHQPKQCDTTTVLDASSMEANREHPKKGTNRVSPIPSLLTPGASSDNIINERVIQITPNVNQSATSPIVNAYVDSKRSTFDLSPILESCLNRESVIIEPNTNQDTDRVSLLTPDKKTNEKMIRTTPNVNQSDTLPTNNAYVDPKLPIFELSPTLKSYLNGASVIREPNTNKRKSLFQEKQPVPLKTTFVPCTALENGLNPEATTVKTPTELPAALNRNHFSASLRPNDNSTSHLPIFKLSTILKDHLYYKSDKQGQTPSNHLNSSVPPVTTMLTRILSTKSSNVPSTTPEKLSDNHQKYDSRYQTLPTNLVTNHRPSLPDSVATPRILKGMPSTSNGNQSGTYPAFKVHPDPGKSISSASISGSKVQAQPGVVLNGNNVTPIIPHTVTYPQGNTDHIGIRNMGAVFVTTQLKPKTKSTKSKTKSKRHLSSKEKRALNVLKNQDLSGFSASYRKRYTLPARRKKKKQENEKTLTKDKTGDDESGLLNIDPEN